MEPEKGIGIALDELVRATLDWRTACSASGDELKAVSAMYSTVVVVSIGRSSSERCLFECLEDLLRKARGEPIRASGRSSSFSSASA